jgi:four helix bundle protein
MDHFDHESLDVYTVSTEFVALVAQMISDTPRGMSGLADQLRRAATSIVLNVAEGAGEFSPREKVRFYRMAKRSATECAAILDAVRIWDPQGDQRWAAAVTLEAGRKLLLRTVSMLIKMVKATESRYE